MEPVSPHPPPRGAAKRKKSPMVDESCGHKELITPTGIEAGTEPIRRSTRIANSLSKPLYSIHIDLGYGDLDASKIVIPRTHRQAKKSMEWPHWYKAELAEINGIIDAGCIINEIPPKGAKIIDSKWVYDIKTNSINQVIKFKARLSIYIEDVGNVYSLVASWTGIRYFLALSVKLGLTPLQLDFELAYLNADLEERIYMRPPQGFEPSDESYGDYANLCMA
jgi:hypothetical protein